MLYADVIVDISVKSLDRPFQYIVPEVLQEVAVIGAQVVIPFGNGNRSRKGYIIGLSQTPKFDVNKTKEILSVEKQGVVAESHLLSLAYWMKENYGGTMNDAIKAVMPVRREIQEKLMRRVYPVPEREKLSEVRAEMERKHQHARVRGLDAFLNLDESRYWDGIDYESLRKQYKITSAVIQSLEERGLVRVASKQLYRNPYTDLQSPKKDISLNEE